MTLKHTPISRPVKTEMVFEHDIIGSMVDDQDDIFDILGISIFATGGVWCTLKNMPCVPFSSCEEYLDEDGKCKYESHN